MTSNMNPQPLGPSQVSYQAAIHSDRARRPDPTSLFGFGTQGANSTFQHEYRHRRVRAKLMPRCFRLRETRRDRCDWHGPIRQMCIRQDRSSRPSWREGCSGGSRQVACDGHFRLNVPTSSRSQSVPRTAADKCAEGSRIGAAAARPMRGGQFKIIPDGSACQGG
jgi:hypothetical protein